MNAVLSRTLPYLWYPALVTLAVATFSILLTASVPLAVAMYAPAVLSLLAIFWLESRFPARIDWRPTWREMRSDAAFMLIVQVFLPKALIAGCAIILADWMHANAPSSWWPQSWPLPAQIILMVLLVDLMRYWLHRACHRFTLLWRLHEVHHSPELLYTLNTARFHPFEKILHFSLDTVPFLMLGVAAEVMAGYFLLYAVNGFFQHSNLHLRYGWLNYVVGSAETHRWHHARDPKIAACNFSNTTIVWDLVFGTWYLPKNKTIDDIGILDKAYPRGFWAQMMTPFGRKS